MNPLIAASMRLIVVSLALSFSGLLAAQTRELNMDSTQVFGDYTVHYSVFNSTFVPPEVARIYGLVRGADRALVNIAVQDTETGQPVDARLKGSARNLIQQSKSLSFQRIEEPDALYWIAPLRHSNEEVLHFDISITPVGTETPIDLKFSRKLYRE